MSSQYGEHQFILDHFKNRDPAALRFLDVGAFDGVSNSNTKPLADLGWSGMCVEPSPPAFCWLMKTHALNRRVELVNAAVVAGAYLAPMQRLRRFHCNTADAHSADQMSTLSTAHRDKWEGHPFRDIWVPVIDWADIDQIRSGSFDFVNIDTEGTNLEVFQAMPFRPEMVCVEADPPDQIGHAVRARYKQQVQIGGNWIGWEPR